MVATGDTADGVPFDKVKKLGKMGPEAAKRLGTAYKELQLAGAPDAARRVREIDNYVDKLDYSGLETLVDPELADEELAASRRRTVRRAHARRNIAALMPLLVTWIALGFASLAYEIELARHAADASKPFLLLWQQGFGHRWFPTFAEIAFIDFAILGIVLWLTALVHRAEGKEDTSRADVIHSLWTALNTLKVAVAESKPRPPATAEEWADSARRIIADAMEQTKLLAASGQQAINEASSKLSSIQDQGRDFIAQFSGEIQKTLVAVREQNEQFIIRTARESRETLQRLVEQQMEPLLNQLSTMLTEFGRHQETYRSGVADLSQGVNSIKRSAQELANSSQAYNSIADSITEHLKSIATSQKEFASQVTTSASSMHTAATAMSEVKDVLRTDLRGIREMQRNVTNASMHLEAVERNLAGTSTALDRSARALDQVTADLQAAIHAPGASSWIRRLFRI